MYYTYAYTGVLQSSSTANLRSEWYRSHQVLARYSLFILFILCAIISAVILGRYFHNILHLPPLYWTMMALILLASVLYYGLLPRSLIKINLRNTGWLKAFVIGFVWAGCVSLAPLVMLQIEGVKETVDPILVVGLFIKNWMFCTVNAIMFDMKDYEDDSNKQLKTFVVRFGIHKTISFVLIPLSLIGVVALIAFAQYRHFGLIPILINLIPFLLLLIVSYSMHQRKSIFYYLIVIDGVVLIKALCGILAMQFIYT
ncbi:MAG: hypothetical protein JWO03_4009 [Bacteroidetes bacterium]|nr:hypothetical protein [Bacteroidota bacterium]